MKLRIHTLWKVPMFCIVASVFSDYLTIYLGGFFFTVATVKPDGVTNISVDPIRSAIFSGILFVSALLVGGLWAFRSMSKLEITVSAAIVFIIDLAVVLAQLHVPNFPLTTSMKLAIFQEWDVFICSLLIRLTKHFELSVLLSCFSPFLFIPFGKKSAK